jgi:hypothetical protein
MTLTRAQFQLRTANVANQRRTCVRAANTEQFQQSPPPPPPPPPPRPPQQSSILVSSDRVHAGVCLPTVYQGGSPAATGDCILGVWVERDAARLLAPIVNGLIIAELLQSRRGLLGYVGVGAGAGALGYLIGSQTAGSGEPSLSGLTAEDRKVGLAYTHTCWSRKPTKYQQTHQGCTSWRQQPQQGCHILQSLRGTQAQLARIAYPSCTGD